MDKVTYVAASGMMAQERRLEMIANNLSNIDTHGFKRDVPIFQEYLSEAIEKTTGEAAQAKDLNASSYVDISGSYRDFRQGNFITTNRKLDVALEGNGFFAVETAAGSELYSRNGSFFVNSEGYLVNGQGNKVLASNGPIRLQGKDIQISTDGKLTTELNENYEFKTVSFSNPQSLKAIGDSTYQYTGEQQEITPDDATRFHQGILEGSNIHSVREIVDMIQTSKIFNSYQVLMKTSSDDQKTMIDHLK